MRLIVTDNYDEMSAVAASEIAELIKGKPDCILGLATGSTPEGVYSKLIQLYNDKKLDFSGVTSFNLDEYKGLNGNHSQSYRYFMNTKLFNHINIDINKTHVPNGISSNIEEECKSYDSNIDAAGGIDLQLLGIGGNGHIGFNEPSDSLILGTHLTDLTSDTIKANSRFFNSIEEVPTQAITMGLGGIMKAKKILLLASGEKKAPIIQKLVSGKISTRVPASILQVHKNVIVIVDKAAASMIDSVDEEFVEKVK